MTGEPPEGKRAKRKRSAAEEDARNALLAAGIDVETDEDMRAAIAAMLAPPPSPGDVWYTKGDLCVMFGISLSKLNRRIRMSDAPEMRHIMGQWMCSQAMLDAFIARSEATKTSAPSAAKPLTLVGGSQAKQTQRRVKKAQRAAGKKPINRKRASAHDPPGTLYDNDGYRIN